MGLFDLKPINPNEQVIKLIHRHWFNVFLQLIPIILIGIALLIITAFSETIITSLESDQSAYFFYLAESTIAVIAWIYAFLIIVDYYLDIWIITNERIINVDQKGMFVRHMSELKIVNIQDVTTEVNGFLPTIFNYGDVHIQTAAEEARFFFKAIPGPYQTKDIIMNLQKRGRKKELSSLREAIKNL